MCSNVFIKPNCGVVEHLYGWILFLLQRAMTANFLIIAIGIHLCLLTSNINTERKCAENFPLSSVLFYLNVDYNTKWPYFIHREGMLAGIKAIISGIFGFTFHMCSTFHTFHTSLPVTIFWPCRKHCCNQFDKKFKILQCFIVFLWDQQSNCKIIGNNRVIARF